MHTRRYSAFISYRHADNTQEGRRWAEWLHRALERYTVPPDLIGTPNLRGEPIRDSLYPIFRDEDELPANADLATGIRAALEVSNHLIVLCSPRSAVSPWVRKEVREFKELGRSDRILAIIIAGEPNADDPAKAREGILRDEECFCEELRFGAVREDGTLDWTIRTEPLAADLRPQGTRAEGFVTAEAYREHLTLNSSLTPDKIAIRVESYRQQLDHGILKVAAGLLGVPLGQLIDRDAAHRAALAKKELERSQAEAARLRTFGHRLAIAGVAALVLALLAGVFWWREGVQRMIAVEAQVHAEKAEADAVKAQAEERAQRKKAEETTTKLRETDAKQETLLLTASHADHEAAMRSFSEYRSGEGLAYLERALSYAPKNSDALAASAARALGSGAPAWRTRYAYVLPGKFILAFSPDGRHLAAACEDKTVRVIEAATGKEVSKALFGAQVNSVSFSLDGRFFAAGSDDKTARVIEAASGKEVSRAEFGNSMHSVSFSPDGRHLAAACSDKTLRIIEAATGRQISKVEFGNWVVPVSFSPDGRYIAAGSGDNGKGEARVIEAATGKEVSKALFGDIVYSISFSPDGRLVAAGSFDKTARVIEVLTGKEVSKTEFGDKVGSLIFSPDGRYLAVGSTDGTARVIDAITGEQINTTEFGHQVNSVSFSPDGRFLAAGSSDRTARIIEVATGKQISTTEFGDQVNSVCFSPDGRFLAVGSYDKTARVIEPASGKTLSMNAAHPTVTSISFSPDGRFLAVGGFGGNFLVLDVATGMRIATTEFGVGIYPGFGSVSFSPDGRHFAAGCDDGAARVFEASTGKLISKTEFGDEVHSVSFSPNGRFIALGCGTDKGGRVWVIEPATGKQISKAEFGDQVNSVSFSPDDRLLAAGCEDKTVRVIEAATGKLIRTSEFGDQVNSVSFSPDGRFLAAGSSDMTVRLIETTTGKLISTTQFGGSVNSVSFSPDGRFLAVGSYDKTARVIVTDTGKEVSNAAFDGEVNSVSFSPDGRFLAAGGNRACLVFDWAWSKSDPEVAKVWPAALRLQSGLRFQSAGKLELIAPTELLAAQQEINDYVSATAPPNESWTHTILKWSQMLPEERTTSPWTTEPIRIAAGRWFMQPFGQEFGEFRRITYAANEAPWHPLEPVSLACLEPKMGDEGYDVVYGSLQPKFLARLTLKRLREADEKLYGRETLVEYAVWCAEIMHEELQFKPEALEALDFALDHTPPEKHKQLLELKSRIEKGEIDEDESKIGSGFLNHFLFRSQVVITEVVKGGQGEALGMQAEDVYVRYNGRLITSAEQLIRLIDQTKGDAIPVELMRAGKRLKFTAKNGKFGTHIEDRRLLPTTGAKPAK